MNAARPNTLVVDFSIMPTRPDPSAAEEFLFKKVKLELKDVQVLQFHNIDRRFYIQMVDDQKPLAYQRASNLKHTFVCAENKKEYLIPVYFLDGASTVRIHDLPPSIPHTAVIEHMRQYGKVINITFERWKNYYGGVHNGVRVLRMYLNNSIPSFLTIENFESYCTHSPFGNNEPQIKTCRVCTEPIHPKTKCAQKQQLTTISNPSTQVSTQQQPPPTPATDDFPPLPTQEQNATNSNTQSPHDPERPLPEDRMETEKLQSVGLTDKQKTKKPKKERQTFLGKLSRLQYSDESDDEYRVRMDNYYK